MSKEIQFKSNIINYIHQSKVCDDVMKRYALFGWITLKVMGVSFFQKTSDRPALNMFALLLYLVIAPSVFSTEIHQSKVCDDVMKRYGLSSRFPGAVAHGIHSITLEDIRYYFDATADEDNRIPTLNYDPKSYGIVLPNVKLFGYDTNFRTIAMRHVDQVLSHMDDKDFYLTKYNTLEQLVHTFHMDEVWTKTKKYFDGIKESGIIDRQLCSCLTDVENNGVKKMLSFMSVKIASPGIPSGIKTDDGGLADWSGYLYNYAFVKDWSRGLKQFDFNKPMDELIEKVTNKLIDEDAGIKRLKSEADWRDWKENMRRMVERDNYELAMFLACALNK